LPFHYTLKPVIVTNFIIRFPAAIATYTLIPATLLAHDSDRYGIGIGRSVLRPFLTDEVATARLLASNNSGLQKTYHLIIECHFQTIVDSLIFRFCRLIRQI